LYFFLLFHFFCLGDETPRGQHSEDMSTSFVTCVLVNHYTVYSRDIFDKPCGRKVNNLKRMYSD